MKKLLTTAGATLALLALTVSPAALGAAAGHPNAAAGPLAFCAPVTGAHWATSAHSGDRYFIHVSGTASCALASTWVPRLTRQPASPKMQGPSGWLCQSIGKGLARGGLCLRRAPYGLFSWGPRV